LETLTQTPTQNPMRAIILAKVTVHIGVGSSGEMLEKARKILGEITGRKPCTKQAKQTVKDFGIREGEPIACLTTLRGANAQAFLKRGFEAVGNSLRASSFDNRGNFAFGIKEHIEIPGTKYDPALGIVGMDVVGTLERAGYNVKRRRIRSSPIGKSHQITKDEAIKFVAEKFGVQIKQA